jgi:hypothetical protein
MFNELNTGIVNQYIDFISAVIKHWSTRVGNLANNQVHARRDPEISADGNSTGAILRSWIFSIKPAT